jgi:uncharacterized protein YqeY
MTIQERIDADIKNMAIEKHGAGGKLGNLDALNVIRKQLKQRQESVRGFEKGGRPDLAAKERREIDYLSQYLPAPLAENEIQQLVREAIKEVGATSKAQMGAVMKVATEKAAGRVEGKVLSQAVQRILS